MGDEENSSIKKLESLIKSIDVGENLKETATSIIINGLAGNPWIDKNKLWVKVMLDYGKKTEEVLKRDVYNQIMTELDKEEYKI